MLFTIIGVVAPLFFIVIVGWCYGKRVKPEMAVTNDLVMDVFMPALIFNTMIAKDFYWLGYIPIMLGAMFIIVLSGAASFFFAKGFGLAWRGFVSSSMFSNWANLGIPLYVLVLGEQALLAGIMIVVMGNILLFSIGQMIYSRQFSISSLLGNPILLSVFFGVLINSFHVQLPDFSVLAINMMGQVTIPLMLFSLGVRLTYVNWRYVGLGCIQGFFAPIIGVSLALLLTQLFHFSVMDRNILLLFGVLPPAIVNFMLAEKYGTDVDQVASMVSIGNLFSLVTIPIVLLFFVFN